MSSDKYIIDSMAYFAGNYKKVHFIIISDDRMYCAKAFGNKTNVLFTPVSFDRVDDMAVVTLCDHVIITVGTFGWWTAFLLGNKTGKVLTDSKPDYSALDVDCNAADFFPVWYSFLGNNTNKLHNRRL